MQCAVDICNCHKLMTRSMVLGEKKKNYCKTIGTYPLGNLTLLNSTIACIESTYKTLTPRWIGVVKELFQTQDQGNAFKLHMFNK